MTCPLFWGEKKEEKRVEPRSLARVSFGEEGEGLCTQKGRRRKRRAWEPTAERLVTINNKWKFL